MLPNFLKPKHEYDLIRLGGDYDGGYLVEKNSIKSSKSLITLGLGYEWTFENEHTKTDIVVNDILLVDKIFEMYLLGMELEYKHEIFGSQFVFHNPKAKSSCGCGTSFSI